MIWDDDDYYAMHWGLTDWEIFQATWSQVWREMRIAYVWPRAVHPTAGHGPAPRGKTLPLPLPRSWLGGRGSDPLPSHTPHTHPLGLTMRKRSIFTVPAVAAGVIALGLTIGAATPSPGVGTPTPSATFTMPAALQVPLEEDDPGWDCERHGNMICGVMAEPMRNSAWKAWDAAGGAEYLLVDTHAKVTLTGYSIVDPYKQGNPELDIHQLALHESGVWYIFTAESL